MFMKTLILLITIFYGTAFARDLICKPSTIKRVKTEVEARTSNRERINFCNKTNDKNLHCAVSCILTLQCFSSDVLLLGLGKEIVDVFTPGDADLRDLLADYRGVSLVTSGRARNKRDCYQQCDSYYPFIR